MAIAAQSSVKNRRKFIRIPSSCKLTTQKILFTAKAHSESLGQTQNIGVGGVLFVADHDYHSNELIKMIITLPAWNDEQAVLLGTEVIQATTTISAICQIIRSHQIPVGGFEIAAKFVDIRAEELVLLKSFIEREAERLGTV
ncbi:MAG: hypothetical protein WBP29_07245 [Candidatus Zixiibacteriota bacterium]